MSDVSVGILLVGRMASTRLKNKLLLEVCDVPLVQLTAERLLRAKLCTAVVLCTTTDSSDDVLANRWGNTPIKVFRGNSRDPFKRMLACAEIFGFSHFIYAGADDVLLDPELCDLFVSRVTCVGADMTVMEGLVCGFTPFLFSTAAARRLVETVEGDITIPEKYMKDLEGFTVDEVPCTGFEHLARPDIRATLDYIEDFNFFETVISNLYPKDPLFTNRDVIEFLSGNEEVIRMNSAKSLEWTEKQNIEYSKVV